MADIKLSKQTILTLTSLLTTEKISKIKEKLNEENQELFEKVSQNKMIADWDALTPGEETIRDIIIRRMDELNFTKDSEFYKGIDIKKNIWHNLVNGNTKTFRNKNIIWKIVFFLEFDELTAMHLFHLNGNAIPPNFDKIDIMLFKELHKKEYDIDKINQELMKNGITESEFLRVRNKNTNNSGQHYDPVNETQNEADAITVSKEMVKEIILAIDDEQLVEIKWFISAEDIEVIMQIKNALDENKWDNKETSKVFIKDIIENQMKKQNVKKEDLINDFGKLESRNLNNLLNGKTEKLSNKSDLWKVIILLKFDELTTLHLFHLNGNAMPPNFEAADIMLFKAIHENEYNKDEINNRLAEIDDILFY